MKKATRLLVSLGAFVSFVLVGAQPAQAKTTNIKKIRKELVKYTNQQSAGPTQNYYFTNGKADTKGFKGMNAGDYQFKTDQYGRAATAKAVLTYQEYSDSIGGRQGTPLEPTGWPASNPIVAITYHLTGRTYHGYLYNRSHSIADSLLGAKSYTSAANFTTGTRPQNVGADQDGGMRYPEELAEDYWKAHPNSTATIEYKTVPIYHKQETMPRGSIVNVKSSDGTLNRQVVVINSVEGIKLNYTDASSNATPYVKPARSQRQTAASTTTQQSTATAPASTQGGWTTAPAGQVYVSQSHKYYSQVTNPSNYSLMSITDAQNSGATQASRGNQYARP
ncbi:hypothetical protein IV38_GL001739 [Lactobacillus selangorensis]|uniref:Uncharacterized protein n=1 Tax=Lactobacillus selangorensis TaxID=81857 RepID=A0A0R2FS45_9LACO|nr:DNA/RNA non-specific endonuclease [Lactobacillus selangorensis]KRN27900.1 hypothetical protein IV38_GL001739 [Lactobacillus selangorensis]KRN30629.1 hypothetical protein IV40_GL001816 [Lactobacillus selangorensis]